MTVKRVSEEECWFVIGAHQAGATERECSELSGLSKTVTHNIITNFKKLGSPHATKLSLSLLLNSTNAIENNKKRKSEQETKNQQMLPRKRGRPCNPPEEPFFTEAIVRQALMEARTDKKPNLYSPQVYPLDRLYTPPTDDENTNIKRQRRRGSSMLLEEEQLPPTPHSIVTLDESSDEESGGLENEKDWSMKDDKELLEHVLGLPTNNLKWKCLEAQFNDRHMAKMCAERWELLKKQLLRDTQHVLNG